VEDTDIGIVPDMQLRLFTFFQQAQVRTGLRLLVYAVASWFSRATAE